jgi:hypothetical protein
MKYMMLIIDTEAGLAMPADELNGLLVRIRAWYQQMTAAGKIAEAGSELQGAETARTIRATGVTDGPFIEAKEVLGGYSVLEADDINEAVEVASSWPGVDQGLVTIEVRPLTAG